jgi:chromosomal replication initiation ATPase DnaA
MSYIEIEKLQILIELRETKIKEVEEWFKSQLVAVSITKEEHMKNQADKEHKFQTICELTKYGHFELRSKSRKRELVSYRHILAYLGAKRLVMSLHLIGSKLNRDHSTIHSSIKKVEDWRSLADQYEGEMIIYKEINAIFDRIMKSENQSINN